MRDKILLYLAITLITLTLCITMTLDYQDTLAGRL